jgi:broad specificity phosphatase PhoE
MRTGGFAAPDEPLDDGGLQKAVVLSKGTRRSEAARWLTSPALAARQTAQALGATAEVDAALRDIAHGDWAGLSFEAVQAADSTRLAAWLADPALGAPGGEGLDAVRARLADWLERQAQSRSRVVAVSHPMVIRAALAEALDLPCAAALRIDIAPLSEVVLSFNRVWRLQAIRPHEAP